MIGKVICLVLLAVVCSAQMDCQSMEPIYREPMCGGEDVCSPEAIYRPPPMCRGEPMFEDARIVPVYRVVRGERFMQPEPECVQQRSDPRTYPVILSRQPESSLPPVVQAPPIVAPVRERPLIRLPHAPIPRERVVSHKCTCTKTVIKPQVIQRVITVPRIQRYIKRGYRPIIENIEYRACPKSCDCYQQMVSEPVTYRRERPLDCLPPQFSQVSSIC